MPSEPKTTDLYWQKEHQGTHVCYRDDKEVAAVQGSGLAGWRYRIGLGEWSRYFGTVVAAKREAELNVRNQAILNMLVDLDARSAENV